MYFLYFYSITLCKIKTVAHSWVLKRLYHWILQSPTYSTPWKEFRETNQQTEQGTAICVLEKLVLIELCIYFRKHLNKQRYLYPLIYRKAIKSFSFWFTSFCILGSSFIYLTRTDLNASPFYSWVAFHFLAE